MTHLEVLEPRKLIGHAVRRARLAQDLKQAQLARRMSSLGYRWHPQTVSQVENGDRSVSAEELFGLALSCAVPTTYFLKPFGGLTRAPGLALGDGGPILPPSVASELSLPLPSRWISWRDDQAHWPDREQVQELYDAEAELERAEQETEKQRRELAVISASLEYEDGPPDSEIERLEARYQELARQEQKCRVRVLGLRKSMMSPRTEDDR